MRGLGKPVESLLTTEDVASHLGASKNAVRKLRANLGSQGGRDDWGRRMLSWQRLPGVRGLRIHPRTYLEQIDPSLRPQVTGDA